MTPLSKSVLIFVLVVLATIFQHTFLDSLYPINRTGLVFVLLFALVVFYLFSEVSAKSKLSDIAVTIISVLLIIPLMLFFCRTLSFYQTKEWPYDSCTKKMMALINQENKTAHRPENSITISNNWLFTPSINYYRDVYDMNYLTKAKRKGINTDSEYIFALKDDLEKENIPQTYTTIFNHENIYLFQKK
ncbi:MAG: hypothetical protein ACTHJT_00610 [Cytophaga sp.]